MSYEQSMRHWKNHRKDKATQPCSAYGGDGISHQLTEAQFNQMELNSFMRLIDDARLEEFPVTIACSAGYYHMTSPNHLSGMQIKTFDDLIQFGLEYVHGFEGTEHPSLNCTIAQAEADKTLNPSGSVRRELERE